MAFTDQPQDQGWEGGRLRGDREVFQQVQGPVGGMDGRACGSTMGCKIKKNTIQFESCLPGDCIPDSYIGAPQRTDAWYKAFELQLLHGYKEHDGTNQVGSTRLTMPHVHVLAARRSLPSSTGR